ncbi:hypothetical protein [Bradyrhizobium sp. LHD-71]|uniref:hypothetical protein n=1 Tax=Bradyrhizobium sp. LHD-71 TaxID=3072141 RepID=UPI00280E2BD0|nr:hypothetical protein [Bradyrhizobium sp. LHD-71]MDQ8730491.1 hypothetical protein [Bradyrhizobium sp. LHD-71]
MWSAILSFLGGPIVNAAIRAYTAKLQAGTTSETIAAELAARELDVQRREAEVSSEYKRALIGRWYEPTNLFGYIMVIYFGKIIVWDKVLSLGVTDSITGHGAEWAGWVMLFYVGKRGFENVARIIRK